MCVKEISLPVLTACSISITTLTAGACLFTFGLYGEQTTTPALRISMPAIAALIGLTSGLAEGLIISKISMDDVDSCGSGCCRFGVVDIIAAITSFVLTTALVSFYCATNLLDYEPAPFSLTDPAQQAWFASAFALMTLGAPASSIAATAVRKHVAESAHRRYLDNMLRNRQRRVENSPPSLELV